MRERNPPRNSQLETHRTDGAWGIPARAVPGEFPTNSSGDRFPHASKNSFPSLQNLHPGRKRLFEFGRREIAQSRVQPLLIVNLL
jgi:hypothetical protein